MTPVGASLLAIGPEQATNIQGSSGIIRPNTKNKDAFEVSSVNKSILLVDDDQEIRELLDTYLTRAGFQVRTTPDGAGFRQALNDEPSDLVILDVMLPDEDGFSLCR